MIGLQRTPLLPENSGASTLVPIPQDLSQKFTTLETISRASNLIANDTSTVLLTVVKQSSLPLQTNSVATQLSMLGRRRVLPPCLAAPLGRIDQIYHIKSILFLAPIQLKGATSRGQDELAALLTRGCPLSVSESVRFGLE